MDYSLALDLGERLKKHCPVDTGALRLSIQKAQGNPKEWIILIGDNNAEISGTPTVQYAEITNYAKTIKMRNGKEYNNPNYHWVNKAVEEWIRVNKLNFKINSESEDAFNELSGIQEEKPE